MKVARITLVVALSMILLHSGCVSGPTLLPVDQRKPIDRKVIEYPVGFVLKTLARGLTAPSSIAFVKEDGPYQGSLLVAESGVDGHSPRIFGWKADGAYFSVYPRSQKIPIPDFFRSGNEIYGPIGGMVVTQGQIFVTHRDERGRGVVSAFTFDGAMSTVVADMPSQGDNSLTDIAVHPISGRLYFGQGSATNSGVVGIDNWDWVTLYPEFCDLPNVPIKLLGYKFVSRNPRAGFFGGDDNVGTAPFHAFGKGSQLRIPKAANDKPTSAIYTISPSGGDLRVWAHGIRLPRGLCFDEHGNLFATNNGMELRGTRPVKDDPDALIKVIPGTWYGWPDFSTDLHPISDERFTEPDLVSRSGYPELSFLVDHANSTGISSPATYRDTLLFGVFKALSGAAKMDFVPGNGPFREKRGNVIVALWGDRSPFATSGRPLRELPGRKIVRIDPDDPAKKMDEFVRNTEGVPASMLNRNTEAMERPIDVKFGPDGRLYILDYGKMEMRDARERVVTGSGRVYVLEPIDQPPVPPAP